MRLSNGSEGYTPNLIRFLANDNSKTRQLLAKAYNLRLDKEIEMNKRHDPSKKYFRLYIKEQK